MDTALTQKFPFILERNLAKENCTGNRICTSCDIVVLVLCIVHTISTELMTALIINFQVLCNFNIFESF